MSALHSWWVIGPERRCSGGWNEPPEYGCDVVVVHAPNRSAAKMAAVKRPEMADLVNENRGDDVHPTHGLRVELADCRHGYLLGEDERTDCPWCAIEDAQSMAAEEEIVNDPWQRA